MSLKIIYGKSGTGKSTYIFNEIANKIKNNTTTKIYIITPEQFSFTAEKKLLEAVTTPAVISASGETPAVISTSKAIDTPTSASESTTATPTPAVISAEVLTFNRMAYRVMKEVGNARTKNLSPTGKSMLIYDILSEKKNTLKFIF